MTAIRMSDDLYKISATREVSLSILWVKTVSQKYKIILTT